MVTQMRSLVRTTMIRQGKSRSRVRKLSLFYTYGSLPPLDNHLLTRGKGALTRSCCTAAGRQQQSLCCNKAAQKVQVVQTTIHVSTQQISEVLRPASIVLRPPCLALSMRRTKRCILRSHRFLAFGHQPPWQIHLDLLQTFEHHFMQEVELRARV